MNITTIVDYIQTQAYIIEDHLKALIPENEMLFQAARHSLLAGGKRIRPILALATLETFGKTAENALSAVCALEILHTYSLIHDDLPCMDDDDFRRGKPTLHRAYNEGVAVLTGDFLLTYTFELLASCSELSYEKRIALIQTLAEASGGYGMIAGQMLDIESEGKNLNAAQMQHIHQKKTGALIAASVKFGGILAEASPKEMALLEQFGLDLGLAFQIVDDILDEKTHEEHKTTYVTLFGVDGAKRKAEELHHSAFCALQQLPYDITLLACLADFMLKRDC